MFRITLAIVFASMLTLRAQPIEEAAVRISAEIQAKHLPFGTVLNPLYAGPESEQLITYTRCGDSAIWTGHYLAAETFRYAVTRSPEALAAARKALAGVRALVDVTGPANLLARCVLRADSPFAAGPRSEEAQHKEYLGKVDGQDHYWIGNTSRDQYMGVFFGLSVAYEHIQDPTVRSLISDLTTRLVNRLLEKDWSVVMPDGDTSTVFFHRPDQQLAILQVGRQVNPARFGPLYDRFESIIPVGLPISIETRDQHDSYFKFNLAAITFYNLVRLEPSQSARRGGYASAYMTFRNAVAGHGNAFFNVVDLALRGQDGRRDAETVELLAAWRLRPRRDTFVDLRGRYRTCGGDDQACQVIPVQDRVRTDFLWQRSPFLLYGGGDGKIESPGIDFILPYWMGRFYGMNFALTVVSAASGSQRLAPDSLASLYGVGLPSGARVRIEDAGGVSHSVTPSYLSASQINFLIPAAVGSGAARISVLNANGESAHATVVSIDRVAPALFSANSSGRGPAAALGVRVDPGGSQQPVTVFTCAGPLLCFTQPIEVRQDRRVYVSLYGTGIRNRRSLTALVGSTQVPVLYSGAQNQFAGLDQVNIEIPPALRDAGRLNVVVTADGISSNPVQIEIE